MLQYLIMLMDNPLVYIIELNFHSLNFWIHFIFIFKNSLSVEFYQLSYTGDTFGIFIYSFCGYRYLKVESNQIIVSVTQSTQIFYLHAIVNQTKIIYIVKNKVGFTC